MMLKESSDGETLVAVGIWFQICGAAEEKVRRPKSVFVLVQFMGLWGETSVTVQHITNSLTYHSTVSYSIHVTSHQQIISNQIY